MKKTGQKEYVIRRNPIFYLYVYLVFIFICKQKKQMKKSNKTKLRVELGIGVVNTLEDVWVLVNGVDDSAKK